MASRGTHHCVECGLCVKYILDFFFEAGEEKIAKVLASEFWAASLTSIGRVHHDVRPVYSLHYPRGIDIKS